MKIKTTLLAAMIALGLVPAVRAEVEAGFELEFLNRLVDLGEDVEPGTRFLRAGLGVEVEGFEIGLEGFQALGSGDYNEVSLGIAYGIGIGELVLTPGFTWIWFPDDSEDTAEVSLGVEFPLAGGLEVFAEFAFDVFESEGFLELGVALPFEVPVGGLEVEFTPSVTLGVDYGMVSGERSFKENNVVVSLETSVPVHEQVVVFGSLNHSFSMGALDDAGGKDVSWFGLGVGLEF